MNKKRIKNSSDNRPLFLIGIAVFLIFFAVPFFVSADKEDLKKDLENQINQIQEQINEYNAKLKTTKEAANTLKNEIKILEDRIKKIQLEIKQIDLAIKASNLNIADVSGQIISSEQDLIDKKALLAEYIRIMAQADGDSVLEIILKNDNFSDFFSQLNNIENIQEQIYTVMQNIKRLKIELEKKKGELEDEKDEQERLKNLQLIQRKTIASQQSQKNTLLTQTRGEERRYQEIISQRQKDIDAIRKQIYMLEGVGLSMSLEQALNHALFATSRTGVRPAFLLAVLKKESSWGTNVGTGTWRTDMNPKDHAPFIKICEELGRNPDTTPVSKKPWYGWGGAMGPAQFLPRTWMGYKDQVAALTGRTPADPWNIEDAFTAAGLKLAAAGAGAKTEDAEWKAAMIYFAGNNWSKPQYRFYGDQVMELAEVIQGQLDKIQ